MCGNSAIEYKSEAKFPCNQDIKCVYDLYGPKNGQFDPSILEGIERKGVQ